MDPLKKGHTENCTQDLKNKKIFSGIQNNDPILEEQIGNCLRLVYKEQFVKKIILPEKLLSPEALTTIEEKSFEEALSLFFNDIRLKKFNPGKGKYEDYLFLLFKRV